jgi:hypothetical protein
MAELLPTQFFSSPLTYERQNERKTTIQRDRKEVLTPVLPPPLLSPKP